MFKRIWEGIQCTLDNELGRGGSSVHSLCREGVLLYRRGEVRENVVKSHGSFFFPILCRNYSFNASEKREEFWEESSTEGGGHNINRAGEGGGGAEGGICERVEWREFFFI